MIPNIGEINFGRYLSKRLLPLTIGIGLLISVFFPATYYFLEYNIMRHNAATYADRFAKLMHDLVLQSETLWKYQTYEYRSILDHLPPEKEMNLTILDAAGKPITDYIHSNYKTNKLLDSWAPSASAPIRFNNRTIGTVEVSLSQEALITRSFLIFIISFCIGSALAVLAYMFPVGIVTTLGTRIENLIKNLHQANETLAAEKERLSVTLRSIGDGVITTDIEGKVATLNFAAEHLTGWKQDCAIGKQLHEVFHIIDEKTRMPKESPINTVVRNSSTLEIADDTILVCTDGTERIIEDSAAPICNSQSKIIGVVLAFRDVTEKKKMAQDLLKTQQLESLGVLAGGIAHDFNNLLTGILGNVSLAMMYLAPEDRAYNKLQEATKAYERARDLTQSLLTFSKGGIPRKRTLSIDQLIMDSASFTLSGSNVRCNFSISEAIWLVDADEGQMSQVINNLIINASQAMPDGGVIDIKVENVTISQGEMAPLKAGRYVRISIEDHGSGIPERHLPKIFDPYFTTKQNGHGLGLATVHSIIRNHEGFIHVTTTLGKGTTFIIHLIASEKLSTENAETKSVAVAGKEKILVMDDEIIIRQVACEILGYLGYRAEACCDGNEAIDIYSQALQAGDPFDAVIMDLTIPGGMGGQQAIRRLLELDPHAKAIVSSGYSNDPIIAYYNEYGFKAYVVKPYRVEEFQETLWSVLHPSEQLKAV